ncbi:hypothetical protein [Arthrobacter zhaoguopingii]|uniref:hypothetical protein n=1 Tax=Arthrobacter zhaoguopingii TaxID=2681491 RepID=UPI00135A50B4|nr:hypothetical protein [Arthrobacter zhaoguopingii]
MTTYASNKVAQGLCVTARDRAGINVDDRLARLVGLAGFAVYRHSQKDYLGLVPERQRTRFGLLHVGA